MEEKEKVMREFNALQGYPQPKNIRYVSKNLRTIKNKIVASYRDEGYYDGDRNNGYGGFKYDGRWKDIAKFMYKEYGLNDNSSVLQIGCEKGFLLHDFKKIFPSLNVSGVEISDYAIEHSMESIKSNIVKVDSFTQCPFPDNSFDLVIAIGVIYPLNLADAIKCIKHIQRVGKGKSFITLGAYEDDESQRLFKMWSVLGSTILHVDEWKEVLEHCNYTGDYTFVTSKTLNLEEEKN
jgi:ubiquinone/menaquinone biosynthesis C-methylase UbiE